MPKTASSGLDPKLCARVASLLKNCDEMSLEDQLKIVDRAIALEKLKLKAKDDEYGSKFDPDSDDEL